MPADHHPDTEEQPDIGPHRDNVPKAQLPTPGELARGVVLLMGAHVAVDAEGVSWIICVCNDS